MSGLLEPSRSILDEVVDTRRHLHRHPEVGFEEHEATSMLGDRLRALRLDVRRCPTETGAVAVLDTGRPGATVMLRADIDALPILEESGVEFASLREGKMHACGHDGHTAILLGAARTLAEAAESGAVGGRYVFVFQPAEEIVSGAKAMIAGGLLDDHRADAVIGLHLASFLESGHVVSRPGLLWAGSDAFEIMFTGPGGHGGFMGRAGNVLGAQAFFVERLHQVVEGLLFEDTRCHCTVGDIRSDGAWNVVPRAVRIRGSLRTFTHELREEALERLRGLLAESETEFEVRASLDLVHGTVPLMNDPNVTGIVIETGSDVVGERAYSIDRPLTVSDDMAEFLTRVPGCYFMLGAKPLDTEVGPSHHSPGFRIDEGALEVGVRMIANSAARIAARGAGSPT